MIQCEGYYLAPFALGEKAVKAAYMSDLPVYILEVIDNAKNYVEGRGVRLEVSEPNDVNIIENLSIIKRKINFFTIGTSYPLFWIKDIPRIPLDSEAESGIV